MSENTKIAIVLITYYPKWYKGILRSIKHTDKVRGDIALEFLDIATKAGYHIILVDGKSAKSFRKELLRFPNIHSFNRRSQKRSPNKRIGIKIASKIPGVEAIVLTEAEKVNLLKYMSEICEPILKGDADIVIPKRENKTFKSSYPEYMYQSEVEGMKIYNSALFAHGLVNSEMIDFDSFFGPRVFRNEKKTVALFLNRYVFRTSKYKLESELFDPEEYSNVQSFPIIQALKRKMKVKSVSIPFEYPKLQKENEEATAKDAFFEKRRLQRLSLLIDLFHFLSFLDRKKSSGLKET